MENQTELNKTEEALKPPTFDELAEQSSNFISAKNYDRGKKVVLQVGSLDSMSQSQKYGTWQAVYNVKKDGADKKYGMSGKIAKTLKDNYGVKDFADVVGHTLTLLVVKSTSGSNTFEVADFR